MNQQKIGKWQVENPAECTAAIPPHLPESGTLTLELRVPHAVAPEARELSAHLRMLGVRRCRHQITPAD